MIASSNGTAGSFEFSEISERSMRERRRDGLCKKIEKWHARRDKLKKKIDAAHEELKEINDFLSSGKNSEQPFSGGTKWLY